MKNDSASPPPGRPRGRERRRPAPWLCLLINLTAFPGLGTIMARRRGGYAQAVIMVAGFVLTMIFFGLYFSDLFRLVREGELPAGREAYLAPSRPHLWALYDGLGLCGVAWIWSLFSSLLFMRSAKNQPTPAAKGGAV